MTSFYGLYSENVGVPYCTNSNFYVKVAVTYLISSTRNTQIWAEAGDSVDGPLMSGFILHQLTVEAIICLLTLRCSVHTQKRKLFSHYDALLTLLLKTNYWDWDNPQEMKHPHICWWRVWMYNISNKLTLHCICEQEANILLYFHLTLFSFHFSVSNLITVFPPLVVVGSEFPPGEGSIKSYLISFSVLQSNLRLCLLTTTYGSWLNSEQIILPEI